MTESKSVYVLEPAVDVSQALDEVAADAPNTKNVHLFCPDRSSQANLTAAIQERNLPYKLLAFESVGGEHDDVLYGYCQAVAKRFSACIRQEWRWSHYVALQDRLVAALRGPYVLKYMLSDEPSAEIILIVPKSRRTNSVFRNLINECFDIHIRILGSPTAVKGVAQDLLDAIQLGTSNVYDDAALESLERRR